MKHDIVEDVTIVKNQILNIKFKNGHDTMDVYKHLPGISLKEASKNFRLIH